MGSIRAGLPGSGVRLLIAACEPPGYFNHGRPRRILSGARSLFRTSIVVLLLAAVLFVQLLADDISLYLVGAFVDLQDLGVTLLLLQVSDAGTKTNAHFHYFLRPYSLFSSWPMTFLCI
jgi:hypothetical protein